MIADGFLVVDKPPGVTSHDIVAIVRAVTGLKKVGHTGTLDPFATGVLPLALGGATRLIPFLDENEKVYDALIRLGTQTDTGDPTGTVIGEAPIPRLSTREVEGALAEFLGSREQMPPKYSAVKVKGRPLYAYARAGQEVEARPRPIEIRAMDLLDLGDDRLRVRIRCSRGTYARVIAEQVGVRLGSLGHLEELRREGSGSFKLEGSVTVSRLSTIVADSPDWGSVLRPQRGEARVPWKDRERILAGLQPFVQSPLAALAHLPSMALSTLEARRFLQTGAAPLLAKAQDRALLLLEGREVVGVVPTGGQRAVVLAREPMAPARS